MTELDTTPLRTYPILDTVFSGMGPTGRLHLGHFHGVLRNWSALQGQSTCYFMIADVAALAANHRNSEQIRHNSREMLIDWLASGIDPEKAVIFTQSTIFEHMELAWLLGLCTPLKWLQAVPAYAEKMKKLSETDLSTIGFLADPLLQAADIFAYGATCIPIGRDQVGHLSFSQKLAERFNKLYADGVTPVLLPPQPHFAKFPALPGLDGDKMSKSYGNAIYMRDGAETVRGKVASAQTARDRGALPNECSVMAFHTAYSEGEAEMVERATDCANGILACSDCKSSLCNRILEGLAFYQENVQALEKNGDLLDILDKGTTMARTIARGTVETVRGAMGL